MASQESSAQRHSAPSLQHQQGPNLPSPEALLPRVNECAAADLSRSRPQSGGQVKQERALTGKANAEEMKKSQSWGKFNEEREIRGEGEGMGVSRGGLV